MKSIEDYNFNTDIDGISNKNNLETSLFDNKFKDMWRILRFNETGFTLNTQKNTMLRKIVNKSIYIRRDAIMYGGKDINPKSINMIGKSKLVIEENDKFEVGAGYRLNDSFSGMASFQVGKMLDLGFAYDFATSDIKDQTSGGPEFLLRVKF